MKKQGTLIFMVVVVVFVVLYMASNNENDQRSNEESTNHQAIENIKLFKERFERNVYHLDKALTSLEELELSLDTLSAELSEEATINLKILHHRSSVYLEEIKNAIRELEKTPNVRDRSLLDSAVAMMDDLQKEVSADSLSKQDIYESFNYTLNALAKADLNISEAAGIAGQKDLAQLALKQAQLHVKNAFLLEYSLQFDGGNRFDKEIDIFLELDSLITNELMPTKDLNNKIDMIIKDLNKLLEDQKLNH